MTFRIRIYQLAIFLLAGTVIAVFAHWLLAQPVALSPAKGEVHAWIETIFSRRFVWPGYDLYHRLMLGGLGLVWFTAAVIGALLAAKVPDNLAIRRLSWALLLAAGAGVYLTFVTIHEVYRSAIGWQSQGGVRLFMDTLTFAAIPAAAVMMVRYFMGYPRQILVEEWAEYDLRKYHERVAHGGWRAWIYPKQAKFLQVGTAGAERTRAAAAWTYRSLLSPGVYVAIMVVALICAWVDQLAAANPAPGLMLAHGMAGTFIPVLSLSLGLGLVLQCLHLHKDFALPEDRDRWSWLEQAIILIACLAAPLAPAAYVVLAIVNWMGGDILSGIPPDLLMIAPIVASAVLVMLPFLGALAASVFYKGAADPRLAMRKITVFSVLGIVLAFIFVLIERTVAVQITKWLGLASETGILIAGAGIAATFGPIRAGTERLLNRYLARWLPLDKVVEGERASLAVMISDLSGYTQLSSRDEKQAMLVAALFQRLADRLAVEKNGRVVKSMGDAVLVVFASAADATHVLAVLPDEFDKAARQIGVPVLPVHSGAHWGEVTVTPDGDVYGQTVNLAARLQASAESGQTLVSEAFAEAANSPALVPVGARNFKNIPDPVKCYSMQRQGALVENSSDSMAAR